ncbi:DUF6544 family protein [Hydrogenimonas urashimensis]|uniref:DUF6544 family protein n=1 Tax=Hydrogenimonas urashimensis TaxID=2740515 RepID=UPI001914E4BA|nr:DUF6544 family protein [Hydrogenimonas urashimensis]
MKKIIAVAILLILANAGFVWYGQASFDTTFQTLAKAFSENNGTLPRREVLPSLIERYLNRTGIPQKEYRTIVLETAGDFRRKPSSRPIGMHALTLLRPSADMLWAIRLKSNPLLTFNALETYHAGHSKMETMLFGIIPTGTFDSEAFSRSELARLLAYGLFNPALLRCSCIRYEPIDERHVKAIIEDGNLTASVVFESDEDGDLVKAISGDRIRPGKNEKRAATWQMIVHAYGEYDGLHLPQSVEEAWIIGNKPIVYTRYRLTSAKRL